VQGFEVTHRRALVLSFALGFMVRLIPEVLAYPYPIGYDSVHYAARVKGGVIWSHWTSVFSTWLLYALTVPIYNFAHADPFLIVKLAGPVLYGLSACGVYWFSSKGLKWDPRKSLIAASFFVFQLAAFRISWDLLRNTLGMAILLFALSFLLKLESWKDFAWFVLLSVLVVFGHELASVVMLVVVFSVILNEFLKRNKTGLLKVLLAVSPSLAVFLTSMYLNVFPPELEVQTNLINAIQPIPRPAGLFFMTNYFAGSTTGFYSGYFDLASTVLGFFILLYLLSLPLVFIGFFRNRALDPWTLSIVCACFSGLVIPFFALDWWDRLMLLLVYPFTFYASNGLMKVFQSAEGVVHPGLGWLRWMKISNRTALGLLSAMILLTSVYIGVTLRFDSTLLFSTPMTGRYFSLAPAVPFRDIEDTKKVLEWVDGNMDDGSCVLVHATLLEWARLCLDKTHKIVLYVTDVDNALSVAASHGYNSFYLVWWGDNSRYYWFTVPNFFEPVFQSGRMAAYQYLS
jgi:hypothetical protein